MRSRASRLLSVVAPLVLVFAAACDSGEDLLFSPRSPAGPARISIGKQPPVLNDEPDGGGMPDFALLDVNPNSATANLIVSPRQHLHRVSAWYFGNAT